MACPAYWGSELIALKGLKFLETLQITFEKQLDEEKTTYKVGYFHCKVKTITNADDIPEAVNTSVVEIVQRIEK